MSNTPLFQIFCIWCNSPALHHFCPMWAMKGLLELQNTLKLLRLRGKEGHLPPHQLSSKHNYSLILKGSVERFPKKHYFQVG